MKFQFIENIMIFCIWIEMKKSGLAIQIQFLRWIANNNPLNSIGLQYR